MRARVTIIMGAYNCESTLNSAIDSILEQTYQDWFFIICDDGSSDSTLEILEEYSNQYPNKFLILRNESNLGLNKTLNRCLQLVDSEFVARQDGDDVSLPDRFEKEVSFLDAHPEYGFVTSSMVFFDENGDWGEWKNPEVPEKKDFLRNTPCFCHAPCMIRTSAFFDVNGYSEDKKYLRCEDMNLWYKLYSKGYKGFNFQFPLYKMRDDRAAYQRRTVQNRLNIIRTDWDGMKMMGCHWYEYVFFLKKLIRHILLMIMPRPLYMFLHKQRLNG